MSRLTVRFAIVSLLLALVAVLPATAQHIPAGEDRWVTPDGGSTFFTFPAGEVEALCGADVSFDWDRTVKLVGVPEPGFDWDTVVARLNDADLSSGAASVQIQVKRLVFKSIEPLETPCGKLNFYVKATDKQPVTKMRIFANSDYRSGRFRANIAVRVGFEASKTNGSTVGYLEYTFELPDTSSGIPWSMDGSGTFRPGMDEDDNCFEVLREKALTLPARHTYYIEQLIAQGKCTREK